MTGTNLQMNSVPARKRSYFIAVGLGVLLSLLLVTFLQEESSSSQHEAVQEKSNSASETVKTVNSQVIETAKPAGTAKIIKPEADKNIGNETAKIGKNALRTATTDDVKTDVTLEIRTSPPSAMVMVEGKRWD